MKKLLFSLFVIALVMSFFGCSVNKETSRIKNLEPKNNDTRHTDTNLVDKDIKTINFRWEFKNYTKINGKGADGLPIEEPYTDVFLKINGDKSKTIKIGSYLGEAHITKDMQNMIFPQNTLSAVQAWYAGGGDDLIIIQQGKKLLVKWRTIDETSEPSNNDFKIVKEILLPPGQRLQQTK